MDYLVGCFVGGVSIFIVMVLYIRDLKKFYKKKIKRLYERIQERELNKTRVDIGRRSDGSNNRNTY